MGKGENENGARADVESLGVCGKNKSMFKILHGFEKENSIQLTSCNGTTQPFHKFLLNPIRNLGNTEKVN